VSKVHTGNEQATGLGETGQQKEAPTERLTTGIPVPPSLDAPAEHRESQWRPTVGLHVIGLPASFDYLKAQRRAEEMLFRSLNSGRLVAFIGSGLSLPHGFPDWKTLLQQLFLELHLTWRTMVPTEPAIPATSDLVSLQMQVRATFEKLRDLRPHEFTSLSSICSATTSSRA
jgi:hypothetical protein